MKATRFSIQLFAVAAAMLLAPFLYAGEGGERRKGRRKRNPKAVMKRLDTDGDGKLTLAEFTAKREGRRRERATKIFGRLDADGDKYVTLDELKAGRKKGRRGKRKRREGGETSAVRPLLAYDL